MEEAFRAVRVYSKFEELTVAVSWSLWLWQTYSDWLGLSLRTGCWIDSCFTPTELIDASYSILNTTVFQLAMIEKQ